MVEPGLGPVARLVFEPEPESNPEHVTTKMVPSTLLWTVIQFGDSIDSIYVLSTVHSVCGKAHRKHWYVSTTIVKTFGVWHRRVARGFLTKVHARRGFVHFITAPQRGWKGARLRRGSSVAGASRGWLSNSGATMMLSASLLGCLRPAAQRPD